MYRLHGVIAQRPKSSLPICLLCYSAATARFHQMSAVVSYRTWSCSGTKESSRLLSTEIRLPIRHDAECQLSSLLKTLFPLLPRTTSSSLRAVIRRTILTDIKTANQRTKNHKLNRAVQAMLFGMIERGMGGTMLGDKGKLRGNLNSGTERSSDSGDEAMWAVVLTKELWKKGVWFVVLALYHQYL